MEECKVQGNHLDAVVNFENAYYHKGVVMPSIFTAAIAQIEKAGKPYVAYGALFVIRMEVVVTIWQAGLESVGIFRQSGSKMAVDSMMERYDCGEVWNSHKINHLSWIVCMWGGGVTVWMFILQAMHIELSALDIDSVSSLLKVRGLLPNAMLFWWDGRSWICSDEVEEVR